MVNYKSNQHQRKNAPSNPEVGAAFEQLVFEYFKKDYANLEPNLSIEIGLRSRRTKHHSFDLGSLEDKVIIECKSHTWTESSKVPSAKLTTWDQAMLYFYMAPNYFRKIFVVKKDLNNKGKSLKGQSLCEYYLETHYHVIPFGVEFWELEEQNGMFKSIKQIPIS